MWEARWTALMSTHAGAISASGLPTASPLPKMGAGASFIEVEELTEALEQDARVVPRTPRGASTSRAATAAKCDKSWTAQTSIKERYVAGWQSYTARKAPPSTSCAGVRRAVEASTRRSRGARREHPQRARRRGGRHGAALHAALETRDEGRQRYVHGPTKKVEPRTRRRMIIKATWRALLMSARHGSLRLAESLNTAARRAGRSTGSLSGAAKTRSSRTSTTQAIEI